MSRTPYTDERADQVGHATTLGAHVPAGRFTAAGLLVVAALGVAVSLVLKQQIEHRALDRAIQQAELMAAVGVQARLQPEDLRWPMPVSRLDALDRSLQAGYFADRGLRRVKLFNRGGTLLYSDDRTRIGEDATGVDDVRAALAGAVGGRFVSGTNHDGEGERLLEVYVPLRFAERGAADGVLELYLAYAPVAAEIHEDLRAVYLLLAGGLAVLFAALFRIVAGASRRLRDQALRDALTGLPNRTLLRQRVERALRRDVPAAVLLIDLDRFKEVNDTLGHHHGDLLLVEVADRLRGALRAGDTLARLGGDEFAVLVADVPDRAAVAELAGRLCDALRRPFALGGVALALEASIGVAYAPEHGRDVGTLLQRADVAMYEAKRGRLGVQAYAPERDPYSPDRLGLLAELRRAIEQDELVLHYQPKRALDGGRAIVGVEALVRWQHPERGLLPPAEFVPLAERTGVIADLTRWVLDAALAQSRAWRDAGLDLPVAVNLAAANVVDLALPDVVAALLERHGVPGDRLECEISEHTVMADPRRIGEVLGRLRALGVRLSLDARPEAGDEASGRGRGTGQSSLAYLKRLPLDEVKIDRSFVMGMGTDGSDAAIVRSTIDLARNLGLEVVAEGVECEATLEGLAGLRCDTAQGYHVSRPLPAEALDAWLRTQAVSVSLRGPARKPSPSSASS